MLLYFIMSFRSGFNSDLILNNLRITGKLVLDNPDNTADLEVDTINCSGLATLDSLEVTGHTDLSTLTVETLAVTGDSLLETLNVTGTATLLTLDVPGNGALNDVAVSGSATVQTLTVAGNTSLNTVDVIGNIKANNELITPAQLGYVSGVTSGIQAQLNGKANLADPTFTGVVTVPDIMANNQTVTPAQLGYVSGVTSGIQAQLDGKATLADPTFTGVATLPTTQCDGVLYLQNTGSAVNAPIDYDTQYFGAIGCNATGGDAEVAFVNMGFFPSSLTSSAFDWYIMTANSTKNLLMLLYHNGNLLIDGLLTTDAITTAVMTVTGQSTLANVSATDMTVSGNLTVTGQIINSVASNMEIVSVQITGTGGTPTGTLPLTQNSTNTTNYTVFPAIYYGYSGSSSGTYSVGASSSNITEIVISKRTSSSFVYTFNKGSADSANYWLNCLVVYNAPGASSVPVSNT
jgi:hypothetical protein